MPQRKKVTLQTPSVKPDARLQQQLNEVRELLEMSRNEVTQLRNKLSSSNIKYETQEFDFKEIFPGNYEHENALWEADSSQSLQYGNREDYTDSVGNLGGTQYAEAESACKLQVKQHDDSDISIDRSSAETDEEDRCCGTLITRDEH